GATFIARGFSGDIVQLTQIIEEAIRHRGFALVDVLSPCVTWNKINTYDWYKANSYQLKDHDPGDRNRAFQILQDDKFALGIIYKKEEKTFEEKVYRKYVHLPLKQLEVDRSIETIYEEFR
ncbi:MAG TPA: 2-oxoacid ferredoxin oxidoreductase, partial [Euryarchaeota archaeon]|nr:2-oxoacid ferredoxin oxidoreductase [Euryarchaeota archaeon]